MVTLVPSYLTCTAAQAQEFNEAFPHNIVSLNQLLEARAISHPDVHVAGFPEYLPEEDRWHLLTFTFSSLLSRSDSVAAYYDINTTLKARLPSDKFDRIVALLSPSCADLLLTLFALIRLGYGVLLLAPQNTTEAIAHLCRVTNSTHLICHSTLLAEGQAASELLSDAELVEIAARTAWHTPLLQRRAAAEPEDEKDRTALIMHTSGSTGMPKPIYHPHRIWTEAIPCMPGKPAFTTTPLFHGGSADLLRSMNAVSTLYLFSSIYPMTVTNILDAVSICPNAEAFLSVPYILKMLAESSGGLNMLCTMNLVSTGGAPLPNDLGDDMVRHGVRLVSRLGSSECGFLMSSHRDYDKDKEWNWLRNRGRGIQLLRFEPMGESEGLEAYELVVDKDWSTRVVSNRPDGSFASGDLYAKHPTMQDTWRYHGRADDVIVLVTGKKVSANPIETSLRACPSISEAIVFGASRQALGVLILPASAATERDDILKRIVITNASQPLYARILNELVIILPVESASMIPKTSKGSVIRPKALSVFARMIDESFERLETGETKQDGTELNVTSESLSIETIRVHLREILSSILAGDKYTGKAPPHHHKIDDDDDLYNAGIDSIRAVLVRSSLQKLIRPFGKSLASNVVLEYPSISKLTRHVGDVLNGSENENSTLSTESQHRLMLMLASQYDSFVGPDRPSLSKIPEHNVQPHDNGTVILTGVTGSLGAHVLIQILLLTSLRVIALVRAEDDTQALKRLKTNLGSRKMMDSFEHRLDRVKVLASDLCKTNLGLQTAVYAECLLTAVAVVHIAWPVNFAMNLESFRPALEGTRSLLELTAHTHQNARFIFCSSTAAVVNAIDSQGAIPQRLHDQPEAAAAMGYAQAKWVAEHICDKAHKSVLAGRVMIARVGQLCGDTTHGIWNESEAWPLLIASVRYTGCLPVLTEELSLLPLDIAARALVDVVQIENFCDASGDSVPVIHVVNQTRTSWTSLLEYLEFTGIRFSRSSPSHWIDALEACTSLDPATQGLVGMWRHKYKDIQHISQEPLYDVSSTRHGFAEATRLLPEQFVSQELVGKWVAQWKATGFLN